jgi:perosamine synthetase
VPVDVVPGSWNLDAEQALELITPATAAVIVVHTFGIPAAREPFRDVAVPVVEDCAHCIGIPDASGRPVGAGATVAITSLHATKLIGAGEGGAVMTDDHTLAAQILNERDYADQPPDPRRLNDQMTDLEAAVGIVQATRLPAMLQKRADLASSYREFLTPLVRASDSFRLPDDSEPRVWYRYAIEMLSMTAQEMCERMAEHGICAVPPVQDWRADRGHPVADRAYDQVVSLPLYPAMTPTEQEKVVEALTHAITR